MGQACSHGEAGSVDIEAVARQQEMIKKLYVDNLPEDNLNFNELGLFSFAPPDHGIASKQMLGKKSNKFQITVEFMCNATGTEKWPVFYIGKSKQLHYFGKRTLEQHGFWYHNNKTAWMKSAFFKQYVFD
ncbi:hypothetical protein BDN67DRAFT_913714 [Paxillus ammoniavirescens]|nr:hypothetical protein BDN67DRAFT_913714 [Paxillus ammoniavirescens]